MTELRSGAWVAPIAVLFVLACSTSGDDDTPGGAGASGGIAPPAAGVGGGISMPGAPGGGMTMGQPGTGGAVTGGASGTMNTGGTTMVGGGMGGTPMGGAGGTMEPVQNPTGPSWTMMGGDARNTYYQPNETKLTVDNATNLQELWNFQVSGFPPGSPVIVDGKVYVMSTGGTYAIDLNTGTMLWMRAEINGTASVAYENGFIYAHGAPAELWKLNASDGSTVWGPVKTYNHPNADGTSSPVVAGGKVIVGHSCGTAEVADPVAAMSSHGGVFAADTETGMEAWHYWTTGGPDTPENGAMVWSTVAIHDGVVYAATGNNYTMAGPNSDSIHAIDLATGAKKWSKQVRQGDTWTLTGGGGGDDTDFGANPIIADVGGKKIVAAGDKGSAFWALDRDTGEVLWSRNDLSASFFAANGGVLMNGGFDGEAFYVVSNDPNAVSAVLHKLNPADGTDMWPAKTFPKVTWGAPSMANGLLVVPVDNELIILNAATGAEIKRFDTGGTIAAGAAAIVDGKIVVQSGLEYPLAITIPVISNNDIRCYGLK